MSISNIKFPNPVVFPKTRNAYQYLLRSGFTFTKPRYIDLQYNESIYSGYLFLRKATTILFMLCGTMLGFILSAYVSDILGHVSGILGPSPVILLCLLFVFILTVGMGVLCMEMF